MKTIILPGYSEKNREWATELLKEMKLDHQVAVHEWGHWQSGGFNLKHELEQIAQKVESEEVNIIAKSVGTSVAMNLLAQGLSIQKLILCGIPFRGFGEDRKSLFRDNLKKFPVSKVVVFQNSKDPLGNFSIVEKFIHSINPKIKVVEKEAGNHNYPYQEDFQEFLSK